VQIGEGLSGVATEASDALIIDEVVQREVLQITHDALIVVAGNEQTKTFKGCESMLGDLHALGVKRGAHVTAIGGGAVQDAATLVTSLYMRGLSWSYVPSTAMSMLDSCIGGKSSINVGSIKNLAGNIYPPTSVYIDPLLAQTLPLEAKIAGLAEAVKICFARGPSEFVRYLQLVMPAADFGTHVSTEDLVAHVLEAKQWFIEIDEFDKRERQLLNLGHTYAHALESATSFAVSHGVAVGIGILAALRNPHAACNNETRMLDDYLGELLRPLRDSLGPSFDRMDWDKFDQAVSADKKGTTDGIRLVLPVSNGGVDVVNLPRNSLSLRTIRESLRNAIEAVAG
jgi:3-dehydroquinate synthase